ncbi:MAG: hypothetical protein MUE85_21465 [Microscillaceae bacterium]|jgi:hypothetical protein|nr:hypothetical protein [Microscillaceae bacterium]
MTELIDANHCRLIIIYDAYDLSQIIELLQIKEIEEKTYHSIRMEMTYNWKQNEIGWFKYVFILPKMEKIKVLISEFTHLNYALSLCDLVNKKYE